MQLSQLGALYWLCSSTGPSFAACEDKGSNESPAAPPRDGDKLKLVQVGSLPSPAAPLAARPRLQLLRSPLAVGC